MPDRFSFALFSPKGEFGQSDTCAQVSLPGKSGELVLMPNAMQCLIILKMGFIAAEYADGKKEKYYVSGGLCQISRKGRQVSVFSEDVIDVRNVEEFKKCMNKIRSRPITFSDSVTFFARKLH